MNLQPWLRIIKLLPYLQLRLKLDRVRYETVLIKRKKPGERRRYSVLVMDTFGFMKSEFRKSGFHELFNSILPFNNYFFVFW